MRKQKDQGYNIMIGPLQPCEAILGFFLELEEKYDIDIKDSDADEIWEGWFGERYDVTWKRSYIESYYESILNEGPKYESWRRWCRRWLRDYDRKNKISIYSKIKKYVKLQFKPKRSKRAKVKQ